MFQSTHPRREWRSVGGSLLIAGGFNPHTHEGSDWWAWRCSGLSAVSIHTPTKGVTNFKNMGFSEYMFQSTHPRRVWRWLSLGVSFRCRFNPHTHEGCDWFLSIAYNELAVSIHTPTKGVTFEWQACYCFNVVSIHTPTKGVTFFLGSGFWRREFQSTHPRRVWHCYRWVGYLTRKFQSTHPRRVWRSEGSGGSWC